jgi:hypothetical protein
MGREIWWRGRWVALACLLAQGCSVSGLSFVRDDRLRLRSPGISETVELPFEVRWSARDFVGRFVVLFDRAPMRPNHDLRALVPSDDPCRAQRGCPSSEWLRERNIYVTSTTSILVEDLPEERSAGRTKDRHELTIILLDDDDRRLGESVFVREFIVDRER